VRPPLKRVGLNLLFLVPGETGGGETYARRLIPALASSRPEIEFVAFLNEEALESLGGEGLGERVETISVRTSGRSRPRRVLAEQLRLPSLLRSHHIDLLHSLGTTAPSRPGVPSVVTVYDVIYATHPEAHTLMMRAGMRFLVPLSARSANRVITISETAAKEITKELGVPRERIDVVYPGGLPPGPATPQAELRERFDLGNAPVVLSVSARRPHKNLARLLEAFSSVGSRPEPLLVLPGYATPFEDELERDALRLGIEERIRKLGWVSQPDLEGLYGLATCFVFPSLAEGFGLPVLEAMERGVSVACSRASSLPEVAGDAARYFDPLDVGDIQRALEELLEDRVLAARLAEAGKVRARSFSWERAARETIAVYERTWEQTDGAADNEHRT
jgi:glycosyltransferase involved in cell wall biosynthesis